MNFLGHPHNLLFSGYCWLFNACSPFNTFFVYSQQVLKPSNSCDQISMLKTSCLPDYIFRYYRYFRFVWRKVCIQGYFLDNSISWISLSVQQLHVKVKKDTKNNYYNLTLKGEKGHQILLTYCDIKRWKRTPNTTNILWH